MSTADRCSEREKSGTGGADRGGAARARIGHMGNVRSLFAGLGLVLIAILAGPFGGGRETARADYNPFAPVSVTLQGHAPGGLEVAAAREGALPCPA